VGPPLGDFHGQLASVVPDLALKAHQQLERPKHQQPMLVWPEKKAAARNMLEELE
jgi:hypothetical protein